MRAVLAATLCVLGTVTVSAAGAGASAGRTDEIHGSPAASGAPAPGALAGISQHMVGGRLGVGPGASPARPGVRPDAASDWTAVSPPSPLYISASPPDPLACAPGTSWCMAAMASHDVTTGTDQVGSGIAVTSDLSDWSAESLPTAFDEVLGLSCPAAGRCVAVGSGASDSSVFALTTDGGLQWSVTTPATLASTTYFWPDSVSCPSVSVCVAVGGEYSPSVAMVATSTDGGADWTLDTTSGLPGGGDYDLEAVSCPSASDCVATGQTASESAVVLSSTDGGATWSASSSPLLSSIAQILSVSCPAGSTSCDAVAVTTGQEDDVIASSDLGATWATAWANADGSSWTISCPAVGTCWVAGGGDSALAGSDDGFATVSEPITGAIEQLPVVACASTQVCLASTAGEMWVTDDGGGLGSGGGPPGGSIAGTVTGTSATTVALDDACVVALGQDTGDIGFATTAGDGSYTIAGLANDEYEVLFDPTCGGTFESGYAIEYYAGAHGAADPSGATNVDINDTAVEGIDADLPLGATISGTLAPASGGAPGDATGVCVDAMTIAGSPPYTTYAVNGAATDGSGKFSVTNLPPANYVLLLDPTCGGFFTSDEAVEFYSSSAPDGAPDASSATVLDLAAGATQSGIAATLVLGATISGAVTAPGTAAGADSDVCVWVLNPDSSYAALTFTAPDGTYEITNLASADDAVEFDPTCLGFFSTDFQPDWYLGRTGTVDLTPGADLTGVDGTLALASGVEPLGVTTASLPGGTVGAGYDGTVQDNGGGQGPYSWSASGLPAGLSIDATTGKISGVPQAAGTAEVAVAVTDSVFVLPLTATATFPLSIAPSGSSQPSSPPSAVTSTSTTTTTTTTLPPPVPATPQVRVASSTAGRSGALVAVPLECRLAACSGQVELTAHVVVKVKRDGKRVRRRETAVVGSASFSLAAGESHMVDVRLNATGRRLLARSKGSPLQLVAVVSDDGTRSSRSLVVR